MKKVYLILPLILMLAVGCSGISSNKNVNSKDNNAGLPPGTSDSGAIADPNGSGGNNNNGPNFDPGSPPPSNGDPNCVGYNCGGLGGSGGSAGGTAGSGSGSPTSTAPTATKLAITTSTLPDALMNTSYTAIFYATGGSGSGYFWSIVPPPLQEIPDRSPPNSTILPHGLNLSAGGQISGTPTAAGSSQFTVKVTDTSGAVASKLFTLTVKTSPAPTSSGAQSSQGTPDPSCSTPLGVSTVMSDNTTITALSAHDCHEGDRDYNGPPSCSEFLILGDAPQAMYPKEDPKVIKGYVGHPVTIPLLLSGGKAPRIKDGSFSVAGEDDVANWTLKQQPDAPLQYQLSTDSLVGTQFGGSRTLGFTIVDDECGQQEDVEVYLDVEGNPDSLLSGEKISNLKVHITLTSEWTNGDSKMGLTIYKKMAPQGPPYHLNGGVPTGVLADINNVSLDGNDPTNIDVRPSLEMYKDENGNSSTQGDIFVSDIGLINVYFNDPSNPLFVHDMTINHLKIDFIGNYWYMECSHDREIEADSGSASINFTPGSGDCTGWLLRPNPNDSTRL